jgi:ribosomal protein L12E/L44/L45/RPP1/RPP2
VVARETAILAGQPGQPLTQKQYLELSETAMAALLSLDAVECSTPARRAQRKALTNQANALLDELQAAHKASPAAPAAAAAAPPAAAAPAAKPTRSKSWFKR